MQSGKRTAQKSGQMPAVEILVWGFAGSVVPAGQHDHLMIEAVAGKFVDHLARKFRQKSKVMRCVDNQRLPWPARILLEIGHRTDGSPQAPQALKVDMRLQAFTYVAGRLSMPHNICKIGRSVIKRGYTDACIVGRSQKGIAGAEAGSDDAKPVIALLFKPVEAAANVDHALPAGIQRTADVGRDCIIRAVHAGRTANVVIRHAQAQNSDPEQVEEATQSHVRNCIRIPVRQQNDGTTTSRGKPAGIREIIFGILGFHRRSKTQEAGVGALYFRLELRIRDLACTANFYFTPLQTEVFRTPVAEEFIA